MSYTCFLFQVGITPPPDFEHVECFFRFVCNCIYNICKDVFEICQDWARLEDGNLLRVK